MKPSRPATPASPPNQKLFPEPPALLQRLGFRSAFKYIGPGALIASVTIGSGELVSASRGGAIFGYGLIWCFVYAGVFKAVQVYAANRHITLTGEHPITSWRSIPGLPLVFPILIALPSVCLIPIVFSALPEILGGYVHRMLGLSLTGPDRWLWGHEEWFLNCWATATLVLCLALALGSTYRWVERISTFVVGAMILCIVVSVLTLGFDILPLLKGALIPSVPDYADWIQQDERFATIAERSPWLEVALYLSAVGGGVNTYLGYVTAIREKGWGLAGGEPQSKAALERALQDPQQLRWAKIWTRAPLVDTACSFFFVILITLLFAILGAEILRPLQLIPDNNDMLTMQERYLTELHPNLTLLYAASVFLAFIGSLYGAFLVYRYTIAEGLVGIFGKRLPAVAAPIWRPLVYSYCFLGGLLLIWLPTFVTGSIIDKLTIGSLFSGAFGCGLWCFAMFWSDKRRMPKALHMSLPLKAALFISGTALVGLGLRSIFAKLAEYL